LIAYRFADRRVYCVQCADSLGIAAKARESKRAREARRARLVAVAEAVPTLAGTA